MVRVERARSSERETHSLWNDVGRAGLSERCDRLRHDAAASRSARCSSARSRIRASRRSVDDLVPVLEATVLARWASRGDEARRRSPAPVRALPRPIDEDDNLSFPSGHTTSSVLGRDRRRRMVAHMRGYRSEPLRVDRRARVRHDDAAICGSRPTSHYLTDVLAGAALGTAFGLTVPLLMRRDSGSEVMPLVAGSMADSRSAAFGDARVRGVRTALIVVLLGVECCVGGASGAAAGRIRGCCSTPSCKATWKTYGEASGRPGRRRDRAVRRCARRPRSTTRALYQGAEWAKVLQACLVAWAATDSKDHAATAIKYFTALLDDLDTIGDHRGGDESGAPRSRLRDPQPRPVHRARVRLAARQDDARAAARARASAGRRGSTGTPTRAIARARRARTIRPATCWRRRRSRSRRAARPAPTAPRCGTSSPTSCGARTWRPRSRPTACSRAATGPRAGSTARSRSPSTRSRARVVKRAGVEVAGHHAVARVAASPPRLRAVAGRHASIRRGDTEDETREPAPHVLTLDAIALGDSTPDDKQWARGELVAPEARRSRLVPLRLARRRSATSPSRRRAQRGRPGTSPPTPARSTRARAGTTARSGSSPSATRRSRPITAIRTPARSRCRAARTT